VLVTGPASTSWPRTFGEAGRRAIESFIATNAKARGGARRARCARAPAALPERTRNPRFIGDVSAAPEVDIRGRATSERGQTHAFLPLDGRAAARAISRARGSRACDAHVRPCPRSGLRGQRPGTSLCRLRAGAEAGPANTEIRRRPTAGAQIGAPGRRARRRAAPQTRRTNASTGSTSSSGCPTSKATNRARASYEAAPRRHHRPIARSRAAGRSNELVIASTEHRPAASARVERDQAALRLSCWVAPGDAPILLLRAAARPPPGRSLARSSPS